MKVKRIAVKNIRSIEDIEFEFNGCSAIVTGKNSIGKSTFLKFLFDRLSLIIDKKPIWKDTETKGKYNLQLDDDTTIEYEVEKKEDGGIKEKLNIIYPDGKKEKLTRDLIKQLYPKQFNIDEFVELTPKEKLYYIADVIGNSEVKKMIEDIEELRKEREMQYRVYNQKEKTLNEFKSNLNEINVSKDEIELAKKKKKEILSLYEKELLNVTKHNETLDKQVNDYVLNLKIENENRRKLIFENQANIKKLEDKKEAYVKIFNYVEKDEYSIILCSNNNQYDKVSFINYLESKIQNIREEIASTKMFTDEEIKMIVEDFRKKLSYKEYPLKPDTSDLDTIIEKEKMIYHYEMQLKELDRLTEEYQNEKRIYDNMTSEIERLEKELKMLFKKMSNEKITFDFNGVFYEGKFIDKNKMSTSELYRAAIYLGAFCLGEIRTLVFDISTFDKNSFNEVLEFAEKNEIQLLVEKPDWDGNDKIKVEICQI